MKLHEARARLEDCFGGVEEGAPRLHEPDDARFASRPHAVWLEYRWYVQARGLAEVYLKWERVSPERFSDAEATVVRVHLMGASPELAERARRMLVGGSPASDRLRGLFGDDGARREQVAFGRTHVTLEHWEPTGPRPLLEAAEFEALRRALGSPDTTPAERQAVVQELTRERSPRVVEALLGVLEHHPSLMSLRVLSEWGEVRAQAPLQRALAAVHPDNLAELWVLLSLDRRLRAWARMAR